MFSRTLTVLMMLLMVPASAAFGQSRAKLKDVDERLKRVELVVDQSLLEMLQEIDALKREIRSLRGELENQTNELHTLRKKNRDLYNDTDQRITELEEKQSDAPLSLDELNDDGEPLILPDEAAPEAETETSGDAADSIKDTVNSNPVFVASNAEAVGRDTGQTVSIKPARPATAQEKQAYTRAYDMLVAGDHPKTVEEFQAFLQQYPDGPYADNAWYWQGEALYAQRKFSQAIDNFRAVINSFPDSPKVPDARLKVGYSLYEQQFFKEARNTLNAVATDFPGRSAAVLARKRLQQMDVKGQ